MKQSDAYKAGEAIKRHQSASSLKFKMSDLSIGNDSKGGTVEVKTRSERAGKLTDRTACLLSREEQKGPAGRFSRSRSGGALFHCAVLMHKYGRINRGKPYLQPPHKI